MKICTRCGFPDTRPGLIFKDGVCQACLNFDKRKEVDWSKRQQILKDLCANAKSIAKGQYDCLIPVSGGKDSYTLVHTMVNMGMKPLLCTVTDSFTHTKAGSHNLRNLITKFGLNHWQYTINHDLFVRATRAAFEETGEALKFVEYAIYTIPTMLAQIMHIPLVVYGENSAFEYGSTEEDGYDANQQLILMLAKMEAEKPWWDSRGIRPDEVESIEFDISKPLPQVIFMSYFRPWSSVDNLEISKSYGFKDLTGEWDRKGTIENFEQMDSVAYMVHLWLKYPKFGFQRTTDIATRRVREGHISFGHAQKLIAEHDYLLDPWAKKDFCETCGYTEDEFWQIVTKHTKYGPLNLREAQ
jgi:N-acetyl sugar amidotransferase